MLKKTLRCGWCHQDFPRAAVLWHASKFVCKKCFRARYVPTSRRRYDVARMRASLKNAGGNIWRDAETDGPG